MSVPKHSELFCAVVEIEPGNYEVCIPGDVSSGETYSADGPSIPGKHAWRPHFYVNSTSFPDTGALREGIRSRLGGEITSVDDAMSSIGEDARFTLGTVQKGISKVKLEDINWPEILEGEPGTGKTLASLFTNYPMIPNNE